MRCRRRGRCGQEPRIWRSCSLCVNGSSSQKKQQPTCAVKVNEQKLRVGQNAFGPERSHLMLSRSCSGFSAPSSKQVCQACDGSPTRRWTASRAGAPSGARKLEANRRPPLLYTVAAPFQPDRPAVRNAVDSLCEGRTKQAGTMGLLVRPPCRKQGSPPISLPHESPRGARGAALPGGAVDTTSERPSSAPRGRLGRRGHQIRVAESPRRRREDSPRPPVRRRAYRTTPTGRGLDAGVASSAPREARPAGPVRPRRRWVAAAERTPPSTPRRDHAQTLLRKLKRWTTRPAFGAGLATPGKRRSSS